MKYMATTVDDLRLPDRRFVFLDRDGVINRKPAEGQYISNWESFQILPGVETAISRLNHTQHSVIVVTNQRGVALGFYNETDVEKLHERFREHLAAYDAHIDAFYYCPHDKNACNCRKPGPGLFEQAFIDFPAANATNSIVIGDSLSDIQAGIALKMPTVFIEGDPQFQKTGAAEASRLATKTAGSLIEAVEKYLLSQNRS